MTKIYAVVFNNGGSGDADSGCEEASGIRAKDNSFLRLVAPASGYWYCVI